MSSRADILVCVGIRVCPLHFAAYAYLVTLKMESRLCVSQCEAGEESFPLYLPSRLFTVLMKYRIHLDLIPSALICHKEQLD